MHYSTSMHAVGEIWVFGGMVLGRSRGTGVGIRCAGNKASSAELSDEREGIDRKGWMLPHQPVQGCLERLAHAAHRRVLLTRRRSEVRSDRMCQGAPESWIDSAWLRLLSLGSLYSKVRCFNIFVQFRGVHNSRHDTTPCPNMHPMSLGAASCGARPCTGHGVRRRGRDSPQRFSSFSIQYAP